jgi:hypothetical protein
MTCFFFFEKIMQSIKISISSVFSKSSVFLNGIKQRLNARQASSSRSKWRLNRIKQLFRLIKRSVFLNGIKRLSKR